MSSSTRIDELWKKFEENPRRYFAPLANEHRKAGDLEQAIAICQAHLPQQPGHISGHIVLAQALFEKGELAEAAQSFETALALDPENLIALRTMGDIARQVHDAEAARMWYERVLDVDPRNDEIAALIRDLAAMPPAETEATSDAPQSVATDEEPHSLALADAPDLTQLEAEPHELLDLSADLGAPPAASFDAGAPAPDTSAAWSPEATPVDVPSMDATHVGMPEAIAPDPEYALSHVVPPETDASSFDAATPVAPEQLEEFPEFTDEPIQVDAAAEPSAPDESTFDGMPELELEPSASAEPEPVELPQPELAPAAAEPAYPAEAFAEDFGELEAAAEPEEAWEGAWGDDSQVVDAPVPAAPDESRADAAGAHAVADDDDWFAGVPGEELHVESGTLGGLESVEFAAPEEPVSGTESLDGFIAEEPGFHLTPSYGLPVIGEASAAPGQEAEAEADAAIEPVMEAPVEVPAEAIVAEAVPVAMNDQPSTPFEEPVAAIEASSYAAEPEPEPMLPPVEALESIDAVADEIAAESPATRPEIPARSATPARATPAIPIEAVVPAPPAFVTETMAELYLQQGFREEALAVYRELLSRNPGDAELRARVAHLEAGEPSMSIEDLVHVPLDTEPGPSIRAFFARISERRPPGRMDREPLPVRRPTPSRLAAVPASAPEAEPQEMPISALFPEAPPVRGGEERAASTLAAAYGAPVPGENGAATGIAPGAGQATRAATGELSLASVFGDTPSEPRPAAAAGDFSFDQFFASPEAAGGAPSAATPSARAEDRQQDIEQFTAWLEGLKRK